MTLEDLPDSPVKRHLQRMHEIVEAVADMAPGGMQAFILAHEHHCREIAKAVS